MLLGNGARPDGKHEKGASNHTAKGPCVERHPGPLLDLHLQKQHRSSGLHALREMKHQ